uniref:Uncharacterized protein n=1 Tax=Planomonospora sp. TaxID=2028102 RepID=A0A891LX50_9ACTN|nr:hypothetical protein [Planomonospora sp.]
MRIPGTDRIRLIAIAETDGLGAAPGFVPRPPGLVAATREDGDLIAVTRTHTLTVGPRIPEHPPYGSGETAR